MKLTVGAVEFGSIGLGDSFALQSEQNQKLRLVSFSRRRGFLTGGGEGCSACGNVMRRSAVPERRSGRAYRGLTILPAEFGGGGSKTLELGSGSYRCHYRCRRAGITIDLITMGSAGKARIIVSTTFRRPS